jgi:hypothetical protein
MRVLGGSRVRDDCARVARVEIGRLLISDFGKVDAIRHSILHLFASHTCFTLL